MLKKIFGKSEEGEEGVKPVKANLGEENKFYYNKELKSWVVRGEEHLVEQKQNLPPPPPKRPTTMDSGSRTESMASISSGTQSTGIRKNLYTSTPGLNITKSTREQVGGIIPKAGFASANAGATLLGSATVPNSVVSVSYADMRSRSLEPGRQSVEEVSESREYGNVLDGAKEPVGHVSDGRECETECQEQSPGVISESVGTYLREDQGVSVPSTAYTRLTSQSSGNTVSAPNRVLPPIPSLPNAAISNREFAGAAPQRRASVQDSPLSFISTPTTVQNPGEAVRPPGQPGGAVVGEMEQNLGVAADAGMRSVSLQGQSGVGVHHEMEGQVNSESDQVEVLYTQSDMRQRQRIRPLSQRSLVSNQIPVLDERAGLQEPVDERTESVMGRTPEGEMMVVEGQAPTKLDSVLMEMISFFGFRYDEKSRRLLDHVELVENKVMNGHKYVENIPERRSLGQVCMDIKDNKLRQMDMLVGKVYRALLDSSSEYDSLMEMIFNIGNVTNKTFQDISGTINRVMSNSDEIEKELIRTRGLYLDLVRKYKTIYKQYETDMVSLRSELENEKNMNISNSKEFEERLQKVQDEFSAKEASSNELLHQYYSYIQNLQQQFEELQESLRSREAKLRVSEEEVPRLRLEIEELSTRLEEKQGELCTISGRLDEIERESQALRQCHEELILESKASEERAKQERMEMVEEHKQELELMEKFSHEQDEQIIELERKVSGLSQEKTDLQGQFEELRGENEIIKVQLESLIHEKSRMEEEVSSATSQNRERASKILELEGAIKEEAQRLEAALKELQEIRESKISMEQVESELRLERDSMADRLEQMSKELEEQVSKSQSQADASREELEAKSEEYSKHINWLENEMSRVDEEWRARQTHLEANYEQLYSQYMVLSSREGEFGVLQERISELEEAETSRGEYVAELERRLEEAETSRGEYVAELERRLEEAETSRGEYVAELERRLEEAETSRGEHVVELEKRLEEAESQEKGRSAQLRESEEEVRRGRSCINELEERLGAELGAREALNSELEGLKTRNREQTALIQELEQRLESSEQYKEYLLKLEQRVVDLERSLEEKDRNYAELQAERARLLSHNQELEKSDSKEANGRLRQENEKLRETNEAVYIKLEAFSRDIDLLNNQLEWIRRYSPQVYETMLENTYHYPDASFGNQVPGAEHEFSEIAL
ncbi:coiled coil-containing protein [Cryptosporidium canis]|uniref:Coiled coil-containing protein n=1 Tax=Cryptosporidium canis TaxID=195482 RepID=A0A9D5DGL1_9CRYT|nr:coiled coil-containing protein [Cryptosporidium canis]